MTKPHALDHYRTQLQALHNGLLARLQAQPMPETVATILQVSQSPLANTARYDSLRAGSDVQEADHA